jgi:hypothetical protein
MARGGGSWRYGVVLWAGLLALATALAVIALALRGNGGLQAAANVAQLVSVVLVLPTLGVPLWLWSRRSLSRTAATTQDVAEAKNVLAGIVDQQWRTEAMLRSLDDPDPIPVRWRLTRREVMDHPANLTPASLLVTASSDDITALAGEFRAMRRRRLVILGGPGTGKTTLAVQLLRELLATRDRHRDEPVPVLLSVAGWDTVAFPRLHDWLAARLAQDYPALRATGLGPGAPAILAARGQILPVLDGLDELPPPAQAAVITALNRSLSGTDQIIVTSRTTDYGRAVDAAGNVLTSAVVIEPDPLDAAAAAGYLQRCLPPRPGPVWEQILTCLRTAPARPGGPAAALAGIAAGPLGLWLLRAVYITPAADPAALLDPGRFPDTAALRAHLFDQLIGALIDTRPPSGDPADLFRPRRRHNPAQVRRWLGYLACHLTRLPAGDGATGTRDFTWWHLARTTCALTRTSRLTIGLALALTIALPSAVADGLAEGFRTGLTTGLAYGAGFGLTAGLVVGFAARSWPRQPPGFADLRLRGRGPGPARGLIRRLAFGLTLGITAGLAMGLATGLTAGLPTGLTAGLPTGLAAGLTYGLAAGLTAWAEAPTPAGHADTPLTSWRADRTLNLMRATTVGLTGGLTGGLATGLTAGLTGTPAFGLAVGLTSGLTLALAAGLAAGDHHAWMAYLITTYRLARAGRLPRTLMPFLDDAHRLGLLRAVGPAYQFRHAELHDHLAATYHQAGTRAIPGDRTPKP